MNRKITLFLLLPIFVLSLTIINSAQSDKSANNSKQAKKDQKSQSKELKFQERVDKSISTQVTKEYDKFKDSTVLSLALMPVYVQSLYTGRTLLTAMSFEPHLYLTATCSFKGTDSISKSFAVFFATKQLQGYRFDENSELTFLADGKRIQLGKLARVSDSKPLTFLDNTTLITNEAVSVIMSADDFMQLVDAKEVEFQVGNIEGKLSEKHLEAFRNLVADVHISQTSTKSR